ncbi:MAG: hypothetical protein IRZ03_16185 [Acidobacterium ailaaui]|nr:hypothetical protein [Pseudacidobacterium ailaaui]
MSESICNRCSPWFAGCPEGVRLAARMGELKEWLEYGPPGGSVEQHYEEARQAYLKHCGYVEAADVDQQLKERVKLAHEGNRAFFKTFGAGDARDLLHRGISVEAVRAELGKWFNDRYRRHGVIEREEARRIYMAAAEEAIAEQKAEQKPEREGEQWS